MAAPDRFAYESLLQQFQAIIATAQRSIVAQVEAAIRSGNLRSAAQRQMQLAAIERTLEQLALAANPLASQMVQRAWQESASRALQQIRLLPVETVEMPGAFTGVSREAIEVMQQSLLDRLDSARRRVGREVQDIYAKETRRATVRAILGAEGSPLAASKELQRRLVEKGAQDAKTGFLDKANRRWSLESYSNMAVRTTTREAVVQGAIARMVSHGIPIARVSTHPGSCEICAPFEGTLVSLGDSAITEYQGEAVTDTGEIPPYHPNAVMEGTRVEPVGAAVAGTRAEWSGPLTHIQTRAGVSVAIGPNHPVLTARGWVAAKLLRPSDQVVRRRHGYRDNLRAVPDENFKDVPALAEHVFETLLAAGRTVRAATSSADLHGDGRFCHGQVDVVYADRALALMLDSALVEQQRELVLVDAGPELSRRARPCPRQPVGACPLHASHGIVSSLDARLVGGGATDLDPALAQLAPDDALVKTMLGGERRRRGAGDVLLHDRVGYDHPSARVRGASVYAGRLKAAKYGLRADAEFLREFASGGALDVALDDVVEVRQLDAFHGTAYDFGTASGVYFADDIMVSNCAHSLMPVAVTIQGLRSELAGAAA